jgi:hypothetical protein
MTNKEKYRLFCENEKSIPIFSQAWWLDSVANHSWDVCLVENSEGIVASMPYFTKKKYGLTILSQPQLTQNLGPWIKPSNGKYNKKLSRQKQLMQELINQLPEYDYFSQSWHYSITNWLPFYWRGFEQTTKYTYVIEDLSELDNTYGNFHSSYRNKIRKAQKLVTISNDMDPQDFYEINTKTFLRQGLDAPYSKCFFLKHDSALADRKSRMIFYAKDSDENIHSSLYLTWDNVSSYVHMVGEDPKFRSSGAGISLVWEAIKYTKNVLNLNKFDFEGSMIESVEQVRRDCGAVQKPYFSVTHKPSVIVRTIFFLKNLIK